MNVTLVILDRAKQAQDTYGNIASTHEALGVASEEWDELRAAIHANDAVAIRDEAMDMCSVLLRLAIMMDSQIEDKALRGPFWKRSGLDCPRI